MTSEAILYDEEPFFSIEASNVIVKGNVGIGITNPSERLHVDGNVIVTGNLAVDTSTLVVDSVNDRVGIGITNPNGKFEVVIPSGITSFASQPLGSLSVGNATSESGVVMPLLSTKSNAVNRTGLFLISGTNDTNSSVDMIFDVRDSSNSAFSTLTSRAFQFQTNNSSLMSVLRNGNVGIGTTNPATLLHLSSESPIIRVGSTAGGATVLSQTSPGLELIAGAMNTSSQFTPVIKFMSSDPDFGPSFIPRFLAGIVGRAETTYNSTTSGGMSLQFLTTPNPTTEESVPTLSMVITGSGNVGIGTTNPISRLHVFTPSSVSGTIGSTRSVFGSGSANPTDVTTVTAADLILDNHIAATMTATSAKTFTTAATVRISGPPIAGTNVTITNPLSLYVQTGNVRFSSATMSAPSGDAPLYMARAWVNFDGALSPATNPLTINPKGSGNVSSITRNGAGDYTVSFTGQMPNTTYSVVANSGTGSTGRTNQSISIGTKTQSSVRIFNSDTFTNTIINSPDINVMILT
jgi:hypothetical protein